MADVRILIDVASRKAQQQLQKLEKEFADLGIEAEKTGEQTAQGLGLISKGAAGAAIAVAAVGAAVVSAVDTASKFQDLETQFIAFTGSAEGAAEQVERLAEFAGETPFNLESLVVANRTLLAFGQSTDESIGTLKNLGEVAAGTGADLGELALIFGQVEAAGKLTGERFLQFAERGINLAPVLAKQLGVAESEIVELRRQGKITAEDVAKAFETMSSEGGKFAGGMKRLSQTFSGASTILSDNIDLLAGDIGKKLLPGFTGIIEALTEGVKKIREFTKETKADKIEGFNNQIKATERTIENIQQQLGAAKKGGFFFELFAGDPAQEAEKLNKELEEANKKLKDLESRRDAAIKAPELEDKPPPDKDKEKENTEVTDASRIAEELEVINQQKVANAKAAGEATNADIIQQLDTQRQTLISKEEEKKVALLEAQGKLQEAQLLKAQQGAEAAAEQKKLQDDEEAARAEEQAKRLSEIERLQQEEDKKRKIQAQQDEFNFEKKTQAARLKFNEQTWQQRAQQSQAGLAALASIQYTGSREAFEIGKAASIAQALVSIPSTAIKAYESLAGIPFVGPGLGAAAAAAAVVAGTARINQIRSTKFQAFQDGGLVQGGIPGVDSVPALLTPGEVVVPERNFKDLKMSDGEVVTLLGSIKQSMEMLISLQSEQAIEEEERAPINVELTLDGQVLANQILELNQDNARIA